MGGKGMTIFLATSNSPGIRDAIEQGKIGRLCTPQGGSPPVVGTWGADSGCYTLGDRFDLGKYLRWLERMRPYQDRCLFAPAPDVVGDFGATLERSLPVLPVIRSLGYPAALVLQDGATPETIPWEQFDVAFIGGTTDWKLGEDAAACIAAALENGKRVHMGRVNSRKRYRIARDLGCESVDGTYLSFGPSINLPKLLSWVDDV